MGKLPVESISAALRARRENMPRTVEGLRAEFGKLMAMFAPDPTVRRTPAEANGVGGEWFDPDGAAPGRVVYYLHGGGYVIGSTETHANLIAEFAKACHARCFAPNYRLAPEYPFPAAVEDALAAYRWLLHQQAAPESIVIAGDSAGGGLTIATLLAARDAGLPMPAAAVCLSPWTDLAGTGASLDTRGDRDPMLDKRGVIAFARMVLGGAADPKDPLASPLYADLRGLPPLLIHVGGAEILFDDAIRFARRAEEADVDVTLDVWEDMIHVWHLFAPLLDEAREALTRIGKFVGDRVR
jgi:monoterpene epsilon-lactone hydrolase